MRIGAKDMNEVLEHAKKLSEYSSILETASYSGYEIETSFKHIPGTWALIYVEYGKISMYINHVMFEEKGVSRLEDALSLINEMAIQYGSQPLDIEFFKPIVKEFLAAWMSSTITHELSHIEHLAYAVDLEDEDDEYNMTPGSYWASNEEQTESEVYARKSEADQIDKMNDYVWSKISELINRLEDVYGFSAEDQKQIAGEMISIWQELIEETLEWFKKNKHTHEIDDEDMVSDLPSKEPTDSVADTSKGGSLAMNKGQTKMNKIFENYFKQNLEEEDVDLDVNTNTDLGQMVADMVNQGLNTLEDNNPAKNRETGLDMIAQIRQKLQDPAVVGQIIEDEVQKMLAELT